MDQSNFQALYRLATTPEALEGTSQYIASQLKPFLSLLEPVLICFPDEGPTSLGAIFKRSVEICGAIAIVWGPDYRWQELLRLAFDSHANTIIAPPQALLGLMKMARTTGTPLYVYDVIACGDPFPGWMVSGLKQGLDCMVWGCYAIGSGPLVAGFSCAQEAGIHIRDDLFVPVLERSDHAYAPNWGRLYFQYCRDPDLIFDPEVVALVHHQPCSCGSDEPRVQDTVSSREDAAYMDSLVETILTWSSVLDFRATKSENGLCLELVVFPDEALPKLPSCAQLTVRKWNPKTDIPFFVDDLYYRNVEKYF